MIKNEQDVFAYIDLKLIELEEKCERLASGMSLQASRHDGPLGILIFEQGVRCAESAVSDLKCQIDIMSQQLRFACYLPQAYASPGLSGDLVMRNELVQLASWQLIDEIARESGFHTVLNVVGVRVANLREKLSLVRVSRELYWVSQRGNSAEADHYHNVTVAIEQIRGFTNTAASYYRHCIMAAAE